MRHGFAPLWLLAALLLGACTTDPADPAAGGGSGGADAGATGGAGGSNGTLATGARVRFTMDGVTREAPGSVVVLRDRPPQIANAVSAAFPNGDLLSATWMGTATGRFDGEATIFWQSATGVYFCGFQTDGNCVIDVIAYDATLRQRIAGTFKGTLTRQMGTGPETIALTDGSFELPGQ
jgi:hypothetical protein